MLETKPRNYEDNGKHHNLAYVPPTRHLSLAISVLLPDSSDVCGSGSRIAGNQITRSNGSGNVGALGEMLALVAGGEDATVSPRGRRSPSSNFAFVSGDCKSPTGVDDSNRSPANHVLSENVDDLDSAVTHFNPWKPEQKQSYGDDQDGCRKREKRCSDSLAYEYHAQSGDHDYRSRHRYGPAGTGSEHLHPRSLSRPREVLS